MYFNQLRWKWDPNPFGDVPASVLNENPASLGTFKYNLRFPGQYFDLESNLNYNYFRDYDPAVGRYVESDPIGLEGGPSTFAYTSDNPITRIDPLGESWGSTDFAKHWYDGSGSTVDLGQAGLLGDFTSDASVQAAGTAAGKQISAQADSTAKGLLAGCQCAGDIRTLKFTGIPALF